MAARPTVTPTAAPFFPTYGSGGFDAYANLGRSSANDETRAVEKGEFSKLIGKLSGDKRAQLQQAVLVFKELTTELPKMRITTTEDSATVKAMTDVEVEKAAKSILVALRKDTVGPALTESIKDQLYRTLVYSNQFDRAVNLYPDLKALVGGRLNGIYALIERPMKIRSPMLEDYFKATLNAREGLIAVLLKKTALNPDDMAALFHFGSRLPIYYLLSSHVDLKGGLCGNSNSTTEPRVRHIVGESLSNIPEGLFSRVCSFAATYA